jgi:hypothetical protein
MEPCGSVPLLLFEKQVKTSTLVLRIKRQAFGRP